jgi:hypothetical protein
MAEELGPHPCNRRAKAIRFLPLCRTAAEVHQIAEQIFRRAPTLFHHQRNGAFLVLRERDAGFRQHILYLLVEGGQGVGRRVFDGRRRRFLGASRNHPEKKEREKECLQIGCFARRGKFTW